ncbi:DUF4083 family protein [Saccharococcus thermophilus]|uniref:DUF4083 domain-containing protein n=1 Tax=Saccharococcus thermophilus TaxID=29396 RepID=A0A846MDL0_9BACL|nr:DUF4083 family protein [Saccharococcus thermophilus]NIK14567.1 hypothetical protein [Saccharococcus thermophilus]
MAQETSFVTLLTSIIPIVFNVIIVALFVFFVRSVIIRNRSLQRIEQKLDQIANALQKETISRK